MLVVQRESRVPQSSQDTGRAIPVHTSTIVPLFVILFVWRSAEFLGKSDEKPFRPSDIAEAIRVLVPDYLADELRAARAESFKRLVDVINGEHDAQVAESVHRGIA